MKRYMAILGFVFVGILAGLLVRGIPIVLHVNAGGVAVATENGDTNGDGSRDITDAIYYLSWLFQGGAEPVALAQGVPDELEGPLASIAESLAYESLKNRHDRFVDNGNRTVTDQLTNLMWSKRRVSPTDWEAANRQAIEAEHAGYTDWRLPTPMELLSLRRKVPIKTFHTDDPDDASSDKISPTISAAHYSIYPIGLGYSTSSSSPRAASFWSSSTTSSLAYVVNFDSGKLSRFTRLADVQDKYSPMNVTTPHAVLVRDIGPGE